MLKNRLLFTLLFIVCLAQFSTAQKFLAETYSEIMVTSNVVYGNNATVLFIPQLGEAVPQDLLMDIYQPVGDPATERPLALVFHTGNFLPNVTNGQIAGTRTDSSVVEICTRLAKMGYTAASVSYRLGWNPLAGSQPERALGLIQAAYRGIQDGRTAVRFFKDNYSNGGNTYAVDPTRVVAIGTGTGGYLVLGMATLDDYTEIINTTNGPAKFLLDVNPPDGTPDTPMVVPSYHGDIEGKALTVVPADGFGLTMGDTTCYPNFVNESSDIQLALNIGGALGDISWLDANSAPIISVQSAFDQFAPYDDAVLIVPTTGDPIVQVQGSKAVAVKQNTLGLDGNFSAVADIYTDEAIANSAVAAHPYYSSLYPVTNPVNSGGFDEGVVVNWWDPAGASPADGQGMGFPWNQLPYPSGGTFHDNGLLLNENMSAAKARLNIDTILGFYAPRAYLQLNLGALAVSNENIEQSEVSLVIAPNPVGNEVVLTSDAENPMKAVQVFDISGRMVRDYQNVNNNYFFMTRGNLPTGTYIMMIDFEDGQVSKKLILD